jgi:modulator of FtsH protease HflC
MRMLPIVGVAVAVVVLLVAMTFFRVNERQQALVLQFGQVEQVITEPGLGWKIPLIQDVVYYEDRILPLETSALEVTPADERRLIVDAFARWRIDDVVQFRQSVQTELAATQRLERILNASLRQVLGSVQSSDVLSPERTVLMQRIRDVARREAENLGVNIIDVRIRRADLPEQNLQATFERMEAERQREAADERARGQERAQEIRATADRAAVELVSDARRQAEIIRGEADAERNAIYADAFGRDEEFFAFYRSLNAYESALRGENSTLVLSPDSEFFDYFATDRGSFSPPPEEPVVAPGEPMAEAAGDGPEEEGAEAPDETATATERAPVVEAGEEESASRQLERVMEAAEDLREGVREMEEQAPAARELKATADVDRADEDAAAADEGEAPEEGDGDAAAQDDAEPAEDDAGAAAGQPEEEGGGTAAAEGGDAPDRSTPGSATEGEGSSAAGGRAETVTETENGVTVTRTTPEEDSAPADEETEASN